VHLNYVFKRVIFRKINGVPPILKPLTDGVAIDFIFAKKSAEEIYTILSNMKKEQDKNGNPDNECNDGMGGDGNDDDSDSGGDPASGPVPGNGDDNVSGAGVPSDIHRGDGIADSKARQGGQASQSQTHPQPQDMGRCGEARDYPEPEVTEDSTTESADKSMKEAMNDWNISVVQASEAAKKKDKGTLCSEFSYVTSLAPKRV